MPVSRFEEEKKKEKSFLEKILYSNLDKEKLDGEITMLDIRKGRIETRFASGRVVIEYPRDKRKKTKIDNIGGEV